MQYPPDQPPQYSQPLYPPPYPQQSPEGSYSGQSWPPQAPPTPTNPYSQAASQNWQQQPPYAPVPGQMPGWPGGQQPKKSRKKLWITLAIIFVVLIIIGAIANGSKTSTSGSQQSTQQTNSNPTSEPTQASQPTTAPTSAASGTHKVGETVSIDNWTVKVNSAKTSSGGQFDSPQHAGDIFLEISVTVTNNTGSSQTLSSLLSFTLKDDSGQRYNESIVTDAPSTPDGRVSDGGKIKGTVTYEVPKTAKTFEFDFEPDPMLSNDVAVWTLSV